VLAPLLPIVVGVVDGLAARDSHAAPHH